MSKRRQVCGDGNQLERSIRHILIEYTTDQCLPFLNLHLRTYNNRTDKGYPLLIDGDAQLLVEDSPVDKNLVLKMLPKLDYTALVTTTNLLRKQQPDSQIPELPENLPEIMGDDAIAQYHKVLFDIHLMHGHLICPDTGRKFPVKDGIPNMILHEDEI